MRGKTRPHELGTVCARVPPILASTLHNWALHNQLVSRLWNSKSEINSGRTYQDKTCHHQLNCRRHTDRADEMYMQLCTARVLMQR